MNTSRLSDGEHVALERRAVGARAGDDHDHAGERQRRRTRARRRIRRSPNMRRRQQQDEHRLQRRDERRVDDRRLLERREPEDEAEREAHAGGERDHAPAASVMRPPTRYANGDRDHGADERRARTRWWAPTRRCPSRTAGRIPTRTPPARPRTAAGLLRRCCTVIAGTLTGSRTSDCPSDSRLRSRHDRDPRGHARLRHPAPHPVEEQDVRRRLGALGRHRPTSPASRATADEHGYFYVAVCDHIAIPESLATRRWAPTGRTASPRCRGSAAQTERTTLLSHAYVLPYRHPLVAAKEFETLDYLSGGRAIVGIGAGHVEAEFEVLGVDHARRGKLVEEKLPLLIEALEHECVNGLGATPRPVQSPRPPVWIAGSSPAAIRRAATYGDGWLPQGPSNAEMVAKLQAHARRARPRRPADDDRRHHAVPLRRARRAGTSARASLSGRARRHRRADPGRHRRGVNQLQVRFKARSVDEQLRPDGGVRHRGRAHPHDDLRWTRAYRVDLDAG